MAKTYRRSPSAFTLIELLVVVGIIGVLLGLLIPNLGKARQAAKVTQCTANYKQIGQTLYTYANDFEGSLFRISPPQCGFNWAYNAIITPSTLVGAAFPNQNLPDLLSPYTGGAADGSYLIGDPSYPIYGNSSPGNFKNWVCPFVVSTPMQTDVNHKWNNQGGAVKTTTTLYFAYSSNSHTERATQFNQGTGFPLKLAMANTGLPMAQDLYFKDGLVGPVWHINHLSAPNPIPVPVGNPSYTPNAGFENSGFGATILFYDGSARHVSSAELQRVDLLPNVSDYQFGNKSVLSN